MSIEKAKEIMKEILEDKVILSEIEEVLKKSSLMYGKVKVSSNGVYDIHYVKDLRSVSPRGEMIYTEVNRIGASYILLVNTSTFSKVNCYITKLEKLESLMRSSHVLIPKGEMEVCVQEDEESELMAGVSEHFHYEPSPVDMSHDANHINATAEQHMDVFIGLVKQYIDKNKGSNGIYGTWLGQGKKEKGHRIIERYIDGGLHVLPWSKGEPIDEYTFFKEHGDMRIITGYSGLNAMTETWLVDGLNLTISPISESSRLSSTIPTVSLLSNVRSAGKYETAANYSCQLECRKNIEYIHSRYKWTSRNSTDLLEDNLKHDWTVKSEWTDINEEQMGNCVWFIHGHCIYVLDGHEKSICRLPLSAHFHGVDVIVKSMRGYDFPSGNTHVKLFDLGVPPSSMPNETWGGTINPEASGNIFKTDYSSQFKSVSVHASKRDALRNRIIELIPRCKINVGRCDTDLDTVMELHEMVTDRGPLLALHCMSELAEYRGKIFSPSDSKFSGICEVVDVRKDGTVVTSLSPSLERCNVFHETNLDDLDWVSSGKPLSIYDYDVKGKPEIETWAVLSLLDLMEAYAICVIPNGLGDPSWNEDAKKKLIDIVTIVMYGIFSVGNVGYVKANDGDIDLQVSLDAITERVVLELMDIIIVRFLKF